MVGLRRFNPNAWPLAVTSLVLSLTNLWLWVGHRSACRPQRKELSVDVEEGSQKVQAVTCRQIQGDEEADKQEGEAALAQRIVQVDRAAPGAACSRNPRDPRPRSGYLEWDEYFMQLALLTAQRSKDPNKQVGAVIVGQQQVILAVGYNGFPRGCSDAALPWAKEPPEGITDLLDTKYPYVVHAEANALLNKNAASVEGASLYVTLFPCNECAKLLIQAGIKEVVFLEDKVLSHLQDPQHPGYARLHQILHTTSAKPPPPANGHVQGITRPACTDAGDQEQEAVYQQQQRLDGGGSSTTTKPIDSCYIASWRLLRLAGVKLRQYKLTRSGLLSV
ncbi:cytidine deaminase-like protein [Haematococcus lacustris]